MKLRTGSSRDHVLKTVLLEHLRRTTPPADKRARKTKNQHTNNKPTIIKAENSENPKKSRNKKLRPTHIRVLLMKNAVNRVLVTKKHKLFLLAIIGLMGMQKSYAAKEIYAALDGTGTTLTVYYDEQKSTREGVLTTWTMEDGSNEVPEETLNLITAAKIDVSMADALPTSTQRWFCNMKNLVSITDLDKLNTSEVTTMRSMFYFCENLTSLDVSHFNTANVTTMRTMFYYCSNVTALDVSHFNTAKVTNMHSMFYRCYKLAALDVSKFNTENVTDMSDMFNDCHLITALDVSHFNTEKVTNMSYMFYDLYELPTLDVSNFNTENVTNIHAMFDGCHALTELNLSNFNTENVTDMGYMFCGCKSLTSLNVSSFNTENVTDMDYMFSYCPEMTTLDIRNFSIGKVETMFKMFDRNPKLKTIYCNDDWSTSAVLTNSNYMFDGCTALVGGNGTTYDNNMTDISYARPDEGETDKGYFTRKTATGIDQVGYSSLQGEDKGRLILRDSRLLILRDGNTYTVSGQTIK